VASLARILLLAPTVRLKSSGIPLSLDEASKRLHVYQPDDVPVPDAVAALVGDRDVRIVSAANYLERFQRECPGQMTVLAGDRDRTLRHLSASVTVPCHSLALAPLALSAEELPILKEALRQSELREVHVRDWMVQRFLPANQFVRDLIHDIDTFGPLLRGAPDDPCISMEWTTNLRSERSATPPLPGEGLLNGLPVLLDLALWFCFAGTSVNPHTDAGVLSARQWPLPVPEETIRAVLCGELPAAWQALVQQGIVLDPANGTCTVLLKDIHFDLTVQGDYDPWPTTDVAQRLEFTLRGLNTTVKSRVVRGADDLSYQQVELQGREPVQQQRLQRAAELWCKRYRSSGATVVAGNDVLVVTFPNGTEELLRAAREAMEQFLRYCRYPQHAELSELDNLYTKAALTLQAVELAMKASATT
jgi:hypothetical protein